MSWGFELALLLLLAAWVGMDAAAFGQVLVSQPLVAGLLAGAIAGDPAAGLAVGVLLQVAYTRVLPLGGVAPEWGGAAAVTGGAVAAWTGAPAAWGALHLPGADELAAALAVALAVGETGRRITPRLRRGRRARVAALVEAAARGDAGAVRRGNRHGAVVEAAASVTLTVGGLAAGRWLLGVLPEPAAGGGAWVATAVLGAGWGMGLRTLASSRRWELVWLAAFAGLAAWSWLA